MLLPGDIICTRGKGWIGRAIRWASRRPGEAATYANHIAGVGLTGDVIEALWTVERTPWKAWAAANPRWQMWRIPDIMPDNRRLAAIKASEYIGRKYGADKLAAHLLDALLTKFLERDVYLARRMLFVDKYPICSWVWAYAWGSVGIEFGTPARAADPDTIHDWLTKHAKLIAEVKR